MANLDKSDRNRSLEAAWRKVRRRKGAGGVDGQSIQKFEWRLERELEQLHQELKDDRYQPRAVRRHWIDKGGGRCNTSQTSLPFAAGIV